MLYNRHPAYIAALILARVLGLRTVLDFEDGPVLTTGRSPRAFAQRLFNALFDRLCTGGTLLASSVLADMTALRPAIVYYGSVKAVAPPRPMTGEVLNVLLGGSIDADTGALRLAAAIEQLRADPPAWAHQIAFEVTGKGDAIERLRSLATTEAVPPLQVWGRLDNDDYIALLSRIDVGLALKPIHGIFANTTFPSKVVEIAASGQLVLSTDISDVRRLFGSGALYLEDDSTDSLIEKLRWIVENRANARAIAARGGEAVWHRCNPAVTGSMVRDFVFAGAAPAQFDDVNHAAARSRLRTTSGLDRARP